MTIQNTYWGYLDWLYTTDEKIFQSMNNIGICVVLPGRRQPPHVHYGNDQFIYILEGESIQIVDGVRMVLSKGMYLFMKTGTCHECINTGDCPMIELLVSAPAADYRQIEVRDAPEGEARGGFILKKDLGDNGNLYAAVESLRTQLTDSFQAPFAIFDAHSNLILQNNLYSNFCRERCQPNGNPGQCECQAAGEKSMIKDDDHFWFTCKYGFLVYHFPILFRDQRLGHIRGGHIICSDITGDYGRHNVYDTPKSTAIGIINLLRQVVKSIMAYCDFDEARLEIKRKNKVWLENTHQKKILENSLRITKDTVTNLKINRHFLFNTLNCMAGMAVQKNVEGLYSAILSLSRLFRYVMPSDRRFVTLKEEIDYLDDYLKLQRFRYGDSLKIGWNVETTPQRFLVPFNFLQPVAENAFTHGFKDRGRRMRIDIKIQKRAKYLDFFICNNGQKLDEATLLRIKKGLSSNSGHGLSLIYSKLQSAYGDNFEMNIVSSPGRITCVHVALPLRWVGPASGSYGVSAVDAG